MTRKVYTPELTAEILAFYAENSAKDTADNLKEMMGDGAPNWESLETLHELLEKDENFPGDQLLKQVKALFPEDNAQSIWGAQQVLKFLEDEASTDTRKDALIQVFPRNSAVEGSDLRSCDIRRRYHSRVDSDSARGRFLDALSREL